MKKIYLSLLGLALPMLALAQGWPANYGGVMLQGFYWNSFTDTRWSSLTEQADELSQYFDLIWVPQSGRCGGSSMGYDPKYFFDQNSTFGTEAQLRTMIQTFKAKGVGMIADVVINHHGTTSGWFGFPTETYNGKTYQLKSTDVCKNDDGGEALTEAAKAGVSLSSNNDTGEDWAGMRDLDHYSSNVKTIVNDYLKYLLNDLGYVGFRYDMVRGFSGSFLGQYNAAAKPTYSVGERWTYSQDIINWMNETQVNNAVQSGAFDFDFRYTVRDAFNNMTMNSLGQRHGGDGGWPMVSNGSAGYLEGGKYRRYAVTFIENHDMEDRGNVENYTADPLKRDTVAANAFMMAMPGTPCVFLKHWKDCKQDIKGLIDVRKAVGITNTSTYTQLQSYASRYAFETTGSNGRSLITVVGSNTDGYVPSASTWTKVVDGYHYCYYMNRSSEIAWIDKASGSYNKAIDVTMTAVSTNGNAKIVYTTDGTNPTPTNGTTVPSGFKLNLRGAATIKAGLLVNGQIKNIQTRVYDLPDIPDFTPHTATVYFRKPSTTVPTWTKVYYWAYDNNGRLNPTATWPGDPMTDSVTIRNQVFYYKTFNIDTEDNSINIVFNNAGSPQTVDITGITEDVYYQLKSLNGQGKYEVSNVTRLYDQYNPLKQLKEGDVDGDGKVDVADVNAILNIITGKATASSFKGKADIDGSGNVDVADVNALINILLNN